MASLRLCFLKSVSKKKVVGINNISVVFRRTNHILSQNRFRNATDQILPKLLTDLHGYRLIYRLEHGISGAKDGEIAAGTPITQDINKIPNVSDNKGLTETLNPVDESLLPPIPSAIIEPLGEASLKSLGLAGWTPPGIMQQILEFFHISFNLPWWAAIIGLTVTLRFFMVPFTIKMRRDMTNYTNNMPEYQYLHGKLTEARNSGSTFEVAQYSQQLVQFLQEKNISPFGLVTPHLVQFPVFISVFLALKGMSEKPELRSFETGGILWFPDLSVPDQFYILPLLTAASIWCTIKTGGATNALSASAPFMKPVVEYGLPIIVFLVTMHFPAATVCYWTTTNIFVLMQNKILSLEKVRKYFNIPKSIGNTPPQILSQKNKGLVKGFKESYTNMKLAKEIEDRHRLNAIRFDENSSAPVRRTFKFNPKEIPVLQKEQKKQR